MSRGDLRVLGPAAVALALLVGALFVADWFIASIGGMALDFGKLTFDLREARMCSDLGPCAVVPMSTFKSGLYPSLATIAFWGGLVFTLTVAYQTGAHVIAGQASPGMTKVGHALGILVLIASVGAGYLFGPDPGASSVMGAAIEVERGWGPAMMLLGLLLGNAALYATRVSGLDDGGSYIPLDPPLPVATLRVTPLPRAKADTPPPVMASGEPSTARPKPATTQPADRSERAPTVPPPPQFRNKIQFSTATGELSRGGIDARREDGHAVLVMWRDVVGLVARRLPPDYDGAAFIDIVSTAGLTLRILPWTRLSGHAIIGDGDERARSVLKQLVAWCPDAKLDPATRSFVDAADKPPAQLPSLELLAKHDQALA